MLCDMQILISSIYQLKPRLTTGHPREYVAVLYFGANPALSKLHLEAERALNGEQV